MLVELQYDTNVYYLKKVNNTLAGGHIDIKAAYYESNTGVGDYKIVRNSQKINLAPSELMEWNDGG